MNKVAAMILCGVTAATASWMATVSLYNGIGTEMLDELLGRDAHRCALNACIFATVSAILGSLWAVAYGCLKFPDQPKSENQHSRYRYHREQD
jgi:hypothetical protein